MITEFLSVRLFVPKDPDIRSTDIAPFVSESSNRPRGGYYPLLIYLRVEYLVLEHK